MLTGSPRRQLLEKLVAPQCERAQRGANHVEVLLHEVKPILDAKDERHGWRRRSRPPSKTGLGDGRTAHDITRAEWPTKLGLLLADRFEEIGYATACRGEAWSSAEDLLEQKRLTQRVRDALNELDDPSQAALVLRDLEELSAEEAAEILATTPEAVRTTGAPSTPQAKGEAHIGPLGLDRRARPLIRALARQADCVANGCRRPRRADRTWTSEYGARDLLELCNGASSRTVCAYGDAKTLCSADQRLLITGPAKVTATGGANESRTFGGSIDAGRLFRPEYVGQRLGRMSSHHGDG
jgi:Sigma-70, region 4